MTKEQKLLLLFVLIIGAASGGFYMMSQDNSIQPSNLTNINPTDSQNYQTNTNVQPVVTANTNTQTNAAVQVQTSNPVANVKVVNTTNTNTQNTQTSQSKTLKTTLTFRVPEGHQDNLTVNVVVDEQGILKDITYAQESSNRESAQYYSNFVQSFPKTKLIGQNIKNISLSRIGGASLTTNAFNEAVSDLFSQL